MIQAHNVKPSSALRQPARVALIPYQGHGGTSTSTDQYHLAASALTGVANGATIASSSFYTKNIQSLLFTGANLDNASTFLVQGENQFGDPVSEVISLDSGSHSAQTLYCYRRVTSIVVVTGATFGADDTLSVGYALSTTTATNLSGEKIPLPYKPAESSAIHTIQWLSGNTALSAQHTWTINLAPYYNLTCSGTASGPVASASFTSWIMVVMNSEANTA